MEHSPVDFALAPCGPLDRLQRKTGITRSDAPRLVRRAIVLALFAWLPLMIMALVMPTPDADVPFFKDIAAHVRFLLIVPLLVMAEGTIGIRTHMVASQFLVSGLVRAEDMPRFEAATARGRRLLDSTVAELMIVAGVMVLAWLGMRSVMAEPVVFWFEHGTAEGGRLSLAGWWYAAVATPIFLFLLLRWAWRYLIWSWFLKQVARLDLRLTGTHPDLMGGLGFVPFHQAAFASITFAVGCAVSAAAANRILYAGVSLASYRAPILAIIVVGVIVGVAPLFVFSRRLVPAKLKGWSYYSRFASTYVWAFEQKWLARKPDEDALGSADIQSLADLGGSYERMVNMRPVAIDRRVVFSFLLAAALPALPLLLTVMPLKDIVRLMFKAVM